MRTDDGKLRMQVFSLALVHVPPLLDSAPAAEELVVTGNGGSVGDWSAVDSRVKSREAEAAAAAAFEKPSEEPFDKLSTGANDFHSCPTNEHTPPESSGCKNSSVEGARRACHDA